MSDDLANNVYVVVDVSLLPNIYISLSLYHIYVAIEVCLYCLYLYLCVCVCNIIVVASLNGAISREAPKTNRTKPSTSIELCIVFLTLSLCFYHTNIDANCDVFGVLLMSITTGCEDVLHSLTEPTDFIDSSIIV